MVGPPRATNGLIEVNEGGPEHDRSDKSAFCHFCH